MPTITVQLETPLPRTFRVEQVAGLFDVPLAERLTHALTAEVPGLEENWTIGAIVGPSGSGKTTLARAAFGAIYTPQPWPGELPIIECLGSPPTPSGDSAASDVAPRNAAVQSANVSPPAAPSRREGATLTIKDLARLLTAVGLGSVPTWLKPYRVLSTGERFRADLARAVLDSQSRDGHRCEAVVGSRLDARQCLVLDEFTSSLDRTIAKTASAALARLLRQSSRHRGTREAGRCAVTSPGGPNCERRHTECACYYPRLVALTCHSDILPWLAPDWIVDLGGNAPQLTRCQPAPLELPLRIERVPQALWREFAGQHYLSGGLAASATCYAAWWDDGSRHTPCAVTLQKAQSGGRRHTECACYYPLAFCAAVAALGWKKTKRITRLVVRPEFQGLGLGMRLAEEVAAIESNEGHRVTITASHPAIVGHCTRSPRWRYLGRKKTGSTRQRYAGRAIRCSTGRAVASFQFLA